MHRRGSRISVFLVYSAAPLEATTISKLIVTDQPTSVLSPWKPERGLLTLFFYFFLPQMEKSVARVLYGQGTSLNLTSRKIKAVPECVFRIKKLSVLQLNNNSISALPAELRSLRRVSLPSFFSFVLLPSSSVCWNTSKTTL